MEVFWCATGLERRGDLLALRAEHPLLWGIEAPPFPAILAGRVGFGLLHSPPSSPEGDLASGIPHSAAAGALATTGKKLTERHLAPCVFLYTVHPLCKQACNGLSGYKKKPSSVA